MQMVIFFYIQCYNFYQVVIVSWFVGIVEIGDGDVVGKLFNGVDQYGVWMGMQVVFIVYYEFGVQYIFGNGVVVGQQCQYGGGVGFQ